MPNPSTSTGEAFIIRFVGAEGKYITVITQKGRTTWFVSYESPAMDNVTTIVNAMLKALKDNKIQ